MTTVIAVLALCIAIFDLLVHIGVIIIKPRKDKFKEFRDPTTGLLKGTRQVNK